MRLPSLAVGKESVVVAVKQTPSYSGRFVGQNLDVSKKGSCSGVHPFLENHAEGRKLQDERQTATVASARRRRRDSWKTASSARSQRDCLSRNALDSLF